MRAGGDLRRSLGPAQVVAAGVSCIVGAGIYLSLGDLVAPVGPFVVLAFVLAGLACGLTALSYARFATRFPEAGSAFSYVLQAYGPRAGWMTGWTLVLEYTVGAGAVVGLWSYLIEKEFGWPQPLVIVISMTVVTGLVMAGIELWSWVTVSLVLLKVGTLLLFCALAAAGPTAPEPVNFAITPGEFLRVAGMAVFSFLGFESVSTLAHETRNPKRDMPVGILGSLLLATLLYVAVAGLYVRVTPQSRLGVGQPAGRGAGPIRVLRTTTAGDRKRRHWTFHGCDGDGGWSDAHSLLNGTGGSGTGGVWRNPPEVRQTVEGHAGGRGGRDWVSVGRTWEPAVQRCDCRNANGIHGGGAGGGKPMGGLAGGRD